MTDPMRAAIPEPLYPCAAEHCDMCLYPRSLFWWDGAEERDAEGCVLVDGDKPGFYCEGCLDGHGGPIMGPSLATVLETP